MKKVLALVFLLGFFSCAFLFYVLEYSSLETPKVTGFVLENNNEGSPSDRITNDDIIILKDKIIIEVSGTTLSSYADTGSMNPFFDEGANGIRINPSNIGDIRNTEYAKADKVFGISFCFHIFRSGNCNVNLAELFGQLFIQLKQSLQTCDSFAYKG